MGDWSDIPILLNLERDSTVTRMSLWVNNDDWYQEIANAVYEIGQSNLDKLLSTEMPSKIFAMVISRKDGTFFIGRLITSLNWSAVSNIKSISLLVMYFIPSK